MPAVAALQLPARTAGTQLRIRRSNVVRRSALTRCVVRPTLSAKKDDNKEERNFFKDMGKSAAVLALSTALLLSGPVDTAQAARGGGRMGGARFSAARSRSYSAPRTQRSYAGATAPNVNIYAGSPFGFGMPFGFPGFGFGYGVPIFGGFGFMLRLFIIMTIINAVLNFLRSASDSRVSSACFASLPHSAMVPPGTYTVALTHLCAG
eukprot:scaffold2318_cov396-Prasinococcus_capsulatus_cf.AAC.10